MEKEFDYLWTFLLTCLYYRVNLSQVMVKHPKKEPSKAKQVASLLIYNQGASCRQVGEVIGTDHSTVWMNKERIKFLSGRDQQLKRELNELILITKP